jgi:biotin carboxylase
VKKILIVGGGVNQMPLILASKQQGYFVVVVDYAGEKCPAYAIADKFYNVSTQDEEGIFEVAKKEEIDGIISNSEPSMLIVNSIAEKLDLNGNPVEGVKDLMSKNRFRELQRRADVYTPSLFETTTAEEAVSVSERINFPIIIKPCESSASRGCKVIESFDSKDIEKAFFVCQQLSRDKKVVVEEYVEMPSLRTIEGDIFVMGDTILWDGLFYTTRASWAPMVPMTYTAPILMDEDKQDMIKSSVSRVLKTAGIRFGEFNMEGFFTKTGEFFIIEINARQGGNFLPNFIRRFTGIDYNRLLVTTSVNDDSYWNTIVSSERKSRYYIMHSVYSQKEGSYKGLTIDSTISAYVTNVTELLSAGDKVEKCVDGTSIVASVDLEFDSLDELYEITPQVIDSIHVELS